MESHLSQGARAALTKIEEQRRKQEAQIALRNLLQSNGEFLSPNSWVVFRDEEAPTTELLERERAGDADASLQRSRDWVHQGWSRACELIRELQLIDVVKGLRLPETPWMDMHGLFVSVLVARSPARERERAARKLSAIRMELRGGRYQLARYFVWLKDQIDEHWKGEASRPTPLANAPCVVAVDGAASPQAHTEPVDLTNLPSPIANGVDWVRARVAAGIEGIRTPSLSNYRNKGQKNRDGLAGQDEKGRVWAKPTTNAQVLYLRSTLRSTGSSQRA